MNYRGLKQAARQSLLDTGVPYRKLTLLFLLCFYVISIPCDAISYVLEVQLDQLSGLSAIADRSRYSLWLAASTVLVSLFSVVWNAGFTMFCLRVSRGKSVSFADFLAGFRSIGRVLALTLLEILYIWLWTMLFVIPGLVAAYRYRMAMMALLDRPELSASQALAVSKQLTYGHKLELFVLDLRFLWYFLPSAAMTAFTNAYYQKLLPPVLVFSDAALYIMGITVSVVMDVLFLAYVHTTYAHAYNWLLTLDRARRETWGEDSPYPGPQSP